MKDPVERTAPQPSGTSARMIRALGLTAVFSGFLIVFVFQGTEPRILENKRRALEKAIFEVIPGVEHQLAFSLGSSGAVPSAQGEGEIYAGYDAEGRLKGVALQAAGQGYQDVVRVLYGYSPDKECLTGMIVLESRETPGLGDKIEKDKQFLANFDCLDVRLDAERTELVHPIEFVKRGRKEEPWQVDGITGATISSKAVARMLDQSTREFLPRLVAGLSSLREEGLERFGPAKSDPGKVEK